jgi:PKD repeat protein
VRFTFSSFSTELDYDTLTIYNGINTSAPVIGRYHGTTSPGIVSASNSSGALTFRFHSDEYVTSTGWAASISCYTITLPPVADFSASALTPNLSQPVLFTDLSTNVPTSWSWSFNPGTITFFNGTNANSQNPQVQFNAVGLYSVTLTATNAYGFDSEIKTNYINVLNCTVSTFPFTEGFEHGGVIPDCWTQAQINNSGINWTFIAGSGNSHPTAAHTGTYNACLKDLNTAVNKTMLITPELNLSALPSPQVKFWHTQAIWATDQDQLTVYYKTAYGGTWTLLATYTNNITAWTQETIPLPNASATYYIAFEGNALYGYGVCIDDVEISSSIPAILNLSNINVTGNQCFDALQTIVVAGNGTTFSVPNGGSATLIAGQNILFNPGTVVASGGYLLGQIAPVGPFCTPQPLAPHTMITKENPVIREHMFFRVYPNPTTGIFTLTFNGYIPSEKINVGIFNMKGEQIISMEFSDEIQHEFSIAGRPAGLYLVRVQSRGQSRSSRIVKID